MNARITSNPSGTNRLNPGSDFIGEAARKPRCVPSPDIISGRSERDLYSWTVRNHFDKPDRSAISVHTPGMLTKCTF
jgi:hypothetical protein